MTDVEMHRPERGKGLMPRDAARLNVERLAIAAEAWLKAFVRGRIPPEEIIDMANDALITDLTAREFGFDTNRRNMLEHVGLVTAQAAITWKDPEQVDKALALTAVCADRITEVDEALNPSDTPEMTTVDSLLADAQRLMA